MSPKTKRDARMDAYIAKAPAFAKPILNHLRELVHTGCPDVEESMKWSRPHFMHSGAIMCGMSAFNHHCAFGFWLGEEVCQREPGALGGMGHFGKLASLADLPGDKEMLGYIRKAAALSKSGAKRPAPPRIAPGDRVLVVPDYLTAALKKNKKAAAAFESFSYSHKKEYVEWITEAKREETRQKRIETMMDWVANGKSRNWKYENC
ncbi:MAG TPA: YdeI/OmpD-associated family protein [Verrucomicrobiae bacterium]|jgi:hypothetical protein